MEIKFDDTVFNVKFSDVRFHDIEVKIFKYNDALYKYFTFYDGDLYMSPIKGTGYDHQIEILPSIYNSKKRCFELYYLNKIDGSHHCVQLYKTNKYDINDIFGEYIRKKNFFETNNYILK